MDGHGVVEYLGFGNIDNGVHQCTILHTVSDEEVGFQQPICLEKTRHRQKILQ